MSVCITTTLILIFISMSVLVFEKITDNWPEYNFELYFILLLYVEAIIGGFIGLTMLEYNGIMPIGFVDWLKRIGLGILIGGITMAIIFGICATVVYIVMVAFAYVLALSMFVVRIFGGKVVAHEEDNNMSERTNKIICITSLITNVISFILLIVFCIIK